MKKILVLRFSSIGDIVLTSPVVRALKEQSGAEIHFLTKRAFQTIVSSNPHIDKVHTFDKDYDEVLDELKAENFDFIVDLHHNLRTLRLKKALKKPSKSFPKLNIRKYFYVRFKLNVMLDIHIVDRYFETVKELGIKNDGKGLDYFIPESDKVDCASFLPVGFQNGYVALALGAKFATKQLPQNKMVELLKNTNTPIVLLGGSEDSVLGDELVKVAPERIFNTAGKCSLNQSASLVQQSSCLITHDTGLMHIASAFKKDILSIWGNTTPKLGMYPYLPGEKSEIFEVNNLSCRPCSKIGYQKCPKGHFKCMNEQDIDAITASLKKITG